MTPEQRAEEVYVRWIVSSACDDAADKMALADAIRAAVLEERAGCARVAESGQDVYNVGNCIARDIRARPTP